MDHLSLLQVAKDSKAFYHQELLRARLEIQEQTFKSASHEIHDHIGQVLSLAKLHFNTISDIIIAPISKNLLQQKSS